MSTPPEDRPGRTAHRPWWRRALPAAAVVGAGLLVSAFARVWYERVTSAMLVVAAVVWAGRNPRPALLFVGTFAAVAAAVLVPLFLLMP